MKFKAEVDIMPLEALLDPQGKAVGLGLANMGITAIDNVRIGKHITLDIEAESEERAKEMVSRACEKLLCNKIMESYSFELSVI